MDVASLTQQITRLAEAGPVEFQESDRFALIQACTKLRDVVENPVEKMIRHVFAPYDTAALRLGVEMGLFDTAVQKGGPITVQELAEARKLDPVLVRRIMRLLVNLSLFAEPDINTYIATPIAAAYTSASPLSHAIVHLASCSGTAVDLAEYFAANGYQNPTDAFDGPWQFSHNQGESFWEWQAKRPKIQEAFDTTMEAQKLARPEPWFTFFPVEEKLKLDEKEKERVLLVDVGGSRGHDVKAFHEAFPKLPGKFVLEDQEQVIKAATDLPPAIQAIGHDFFTPQPDIAKGAKAYYLRMILHDWPDKQAKLILKQVKDAMAPDSVLIVNEQVLPEKGVNSFEAHMDIHMMVPLAALERTEKEWRVLLEETGFEVKGVWKGDKATQIKMAVIEAVLAPAK